MKHPRIVRFYLSALQEPDSVNRARIERSVDLDRAARDRKLAALDAERLRNAPVALAYFLAVATVVVPISALVWWLVSR